MSSSHAYPCSECGRRLRGGVPGRILACAHCGNPVVVPEPTGHPSYASRGGATRGEDLKDSPSTERSPRDARNAQNLPSNDEVHIPWGKVVAVLALIGAAHFGIYELATGDARRSVHEIETRYGAHELAAEIRPGPAPSPQSEAFAEWRKLQDRSEASETHRTKARYIALVRGALIASFLLQVALIMWMVAKTRHSMRRSTRSRRT